MQKALFVALGGVLGAISRYLITVLFAQKLSNIFPYAILTVNVVGCFIIGLFFGLTGSSEHTKLFVVTGFLGSLTTFSAFSIDTILLLQNDQPLLALTNVLANVIFGLLATYLGMNITKFF